MIAACSELAKSLGEDLAGSAPSEELILVVERPGPWERDAIPPEIQVPEGVRVQAVRRSTRRYPNEGCVAWLAGLRPGARFLERLSMDALPVLQAGAYGPTGAGNLEDEELFLVCTHTTRDACCARLGLPLAREVMKAAEGRAWHSSHLGGHRFAATMACLPSGLWLGRVPPDDAAAVVAEVRAGRVPVEFLRGRAGIPAHAQAAEAHVRHAHGVLGLDDLEVEVLDAERVRVGDRLLGVREVPTGEERPLSCGMAAKVEDPGRFEVTELPG
jgi:hypothetical protein